MRMLRVTTLLMLLGLCGLMTAGGAMGATLPSNRAAAAASLPPNWQAQAVGDEPSVISCPTNTWCVAAGGRDAYIKDGNTWTGPTEIDPAGGLGAISCVPDESCMAGDRHGNLFITRLWGGSPTHLRWHKARSASLNSAITSIACQATNFCMATDADDAVVLFDNGRWSRPKVVDRGGGTLHVSCPTVQRCVIADDRGRVLTYNGARWSQPVWQDAKRGGYKGLFRETRGFISLSCPARNFCAALDARGFVRMFNGRRWTTSNKSSLNVGESVSWIAAISCSSSKHCTAVGADCNQTACAAGSYLYLYNSGRWNAGTDDVAANGPSIAVSCAQSGRAHPKRGDCVALDADGGWYAGGPGGWHEPSNSGDFPPLGNPALNAGELQCVSSSFCMALTNNGDAVTFNGSSWGAATVVDANVGPVIDEFTAFTALSCPTAGFCAAADSNGDVFLYSNGSWSKGVQITKQSGGVIALSCTSSTFCVASDEPFSNTTGKAQPGDAFIYDGSSWVKQRAVDGDGGYLTSVACTSSSFCGALDSTGKFLSFNGGTWSAPQAAGGFGETLACAGSSFCVETGQSSNADNEDAIERAATFNGSSWTPPVQLGAVRVRGALVASTNTELSCAAAGSCLLISPVDGKLYTLDGGNWSSGRGIGKQPNIANNDQPPAASCANDGYCMIVGADNGTPLLSANPF